MSGDLVNASPADVRKLAKSLENYERKLIEITKEAEKAINAARWGDKQKDKFEARFKDFSKQSRNFVGGEVKQMVQSLNGLASHLERARDQRF